MSLPAPRSPPAEDERWLPRQREQRAAGVSGEGRQLHLGALARYISARWPGDVHTFAGTFADLLSEEALFDFQHGTSHSRFMTDDGRGR